MKERKYKEDWASETRLNEKTGRPMVVPVYKGPWFERQDGSGRAALILRGGIPLFFFLVLIVAYFRLNFPGATALYVFLPTALSLFPALYWFFGIWGVFRAPQKMTRLQMETGVGRVLRSAAACLILMCAALIGDTVLLFAGKAEREWPGMLMLTAAGALSLFTARYFHSIQSRLMKKENDAA